MKSTFFLSRFALFSEDRMQVGEKEDSAKPPEATRRNPRELRRDIKRQRNCNACQLMSVDPIHSRSSDWPFGHFTIVRDETTRVPFHEKEWVVGVSYWSIVIPLTLLSAWLMLNKPRWKKGEAEPVPHQEA